MKVRRLTIKRTIGFSVLSLIIPLLFLYCNTHRVATFKMTNTFAFFACGGIADVVVFIGVLFWAKVFEFFYWIFYKE